MKKYSQFLSPFFLLFLVAILVGCNDEDDVISKDILVAVAGDEKVAKVNEEISFDGSASYARDNKSFLYNWAVTTKPQGSLATFENSTAVKPTFKPDVAGLYVIQLQITRDNLSATDELKLSVTTDDTEGPVTIFLNEDISENTVLNDIFEDPTQPDYRATADIAVRADLVIMPGVTIVFEENTALEIVTGSIKARGLANKRIVFKGLTDHPGFWKGIIIHTNSDLNEMEYVTVRQGGGSIFAPSNTQANVSLVGTETSGAALKVVHSSFSESGAYGLYAQGMSALNAFANNLFTNNALAAAYIPAGQLHKIDAESFSDSNNGFQTVETGGPVLLESEITWKSLPYLVSSDITINVGVTIAAGSSFRFVDGMTMYVKNNGYLHAAGTQASRICFTSVNPNAYWNGMYFNTYSDHNKIEFSDISNGGANRISDAEHEGNIVIGHNGILKIENSIIKNGLGYGIVAKSINGLNTNVTVANTFSNLQKGLIFPAQFEDLPPVTGVWLDLWSFNRNAGNIANNIYNTNTGIWFGGADNPWAIADASFGIRIEENGHFTWTIAEHSPMTGCESYSAEFITGQATVSSGAISFQQEYWRSKFVNKCDESQNVDTGVTPSEIILPYTINKMYNVLTGEQYWELKLTNPDNSTFSFYRR
jgi:hypothetical protein